MNNATQLRAGPAAERPPEPARDVNESVAELSALAQDIYASLDQLSKRCQDLIIQRPDKPGETYPQPPQPSRSPLAGRMKDIAGSLCVINERIKRLEADIQI